MDKILGKLQIDGFSSVAGGEYEKVIINGMGTITTAVKANSIDVKGTASFQGPVECEKLEVKGSASFKDALQTDILKVSGSNRIDASVKAKEVKIEGHSNISGDLNSEKVKIDGKASVGGDCNTESFKSSGNVKIGGQLNAETVDIYLYFKCEIGEVVGSEINIRSGHVGKDNKVMKLLDNVIPGVQPGVLDVGMIEGDRLELENVKAVEVKGCDVVIGPNCHIDYLEYSGSLTVDGSSTVNATSKV